METVCHNCGSKNLLTETNGDEFKYFCCVCGSDYMKFRDYLNNNAVTEIKTHNIGVKIWKEVNVKQIKFSFISTKSCVDEFVKICNKAICKNKLEIAEYIIKKEGNENVYEKFDIITNQKSYIKP